MTELRTVSQIWCIFSAIAVASLADEPAPQPFEITVQRAESGVDFFRLDGKKVSYGVVKLAQVCREQSFKPSRVNGFKMNVLSPLSRDAVLELCDVFVCEEMYPLQVQIKHRNEWRTIKYHVDDERFDRTIKKYYGDKKKDRG